MIMEEEAAAAAAGKEDKDQDPDPIVVASLSRSSSSSSSTSSRRLNAGAPEFVPRSSTTSTSSSSSSPTTPTPTPRLVVVMPHNHNHNHNHNAFSPSPTSSPLFHHHHHAFGFPKQEPQATVAAAAGVDPPTTRNNNNAVSLPDDARHKILNQVEYYFSDVNLATTDHLMKFISKDPDGYVPISVVASFKKIKSLVNSNPQLATVLRKSSKLVVSDDGKKVRRQHPLTESDMEELQSRIVLAENLPEDHSYQNLMKVFSAVGSVRTIRTCQPQNSNGGASATPRSKFENTLSMNKLHAFVEYETIEIAEKAVNELNDERNWRSGLKVRLMPKRMSKCMQARGRKFGIEEGNGEEDDLSTSEQLNEKQLEDPTDLTLHELNVEDSLHDKEGNARRGRGRGRGKSRGGRGQGQHHNSRGSHIGTPPSSNLIQGEQSSVSKLHPPGPRMPDGTRGFTMGRGKLLVSDVA